MFYFFSLQTDNQKMNGLSQFIESLSLSWMFIMARNVVNINGVPSQHTHMILVQDYAFYEYDWKQM